ncbi:MAG: hypothetical protein IKK72_06805 [Oscillospiraceae bacterium]|nr:hypothetical protein [Oscillospiraceae bacterium]
MRYRQFYLTLLLAFLIGNHKGFIALWRDNAGDPSIVFPYSVASLPLQDQQLVNKGIYLQSEEELHRLLEDYLS